ncbi:hypothetical protein OG203_02500 [Nocardia sp. NBC_01499]|uniref:DUF6585 family protein n=1 Tax=Nocardia sp. NBC_01499 TaxID=2903597 RepID=UPI003868C51A
MLGQIAQAASQAELGQHRSVHLAGPSPHRNDLRNAILAVVVLVPVTLVGVVTKAPWAMFSAIGAAIFGLALLVVVLQSRPYLVADRCLRLDLYERGLVAVQRGGLRVVRYANTSVRQSITTFQRTGRTEYRYRITDIAGAQVELRGNLEHPQDWGPAIQSGVADAQTPMMWSTVQSGQRVEFGPFWMTLSEFGSARKSVPWNQIERIKIGDGSVVVAVVGQLLIMASAEVRDIPNFLIFRALAAHLCKMHGREDAMPA